VMPLRTSVDDSHCYQELVSWFNVLCAVCYAVLL